jgi:hypothetical protein
MFIIIIIKFGGGERRRSGRSGEPWGRPMSSSGRLSADMMMMMIETTIILKFITIVLYSLPFFL